MFRFSQSPVSRRAAAPFGAMPVQQQSQGMPMQMIAPALPPQSQPKQAEPGVFQGINGLLDMDETKKGADWFKGLFPSQEEQQANEFMGLLGGYPDGGQMHANEFSGLIGGMSPSMGIMPGEWDWMKRGGSLFGPFDWLPLNL